MQSLCSAYCTQQKQQMKRQSWILQRPATNGSYWIALPSNWISWYKYNLSENANVYILQYLYLNIVGQKCFNNLEAYDANFKKKFWNICRAVEVSS